MTSPLPERIEQLQNLSVDYGGHASFEKGHCASELVSWLADEPFSASPRCACPTILSMLVRLNDRMGMGADGDDLRKEILRPILPKVVGTAGSFELRKRRAYLAANAAVHVFAPMALDAAKKPELAERLRAAPAVVDSSSARGARDIINEVRRLLPYADAADAAAAAATYAAAAAAAAAAADAAAARSEMADLCITAIRQALEIR